MATAVIGTQTTDMHAGELAYPGTARLGEKGLGLFREGLAEGVPIALGYFAVSFSLGIAAKMSGLTLSQGVVTSFLCNASAGEYAGFTMVAANASYLELAVMMLIANARYLLMGCVLSQRFSPDTPVWMRALIAFDNTDEIFAVNVAHKGDVRPARALGLMALPLVGWAGGTAVGMLVGGVLPKLLVQALSVSLFGMFLAVIIPPARQNRVVAGVVAVSFAASLAASVAPLFSAVGEGVRTIVLTLAISAAAAVLFPCPEDDAEAGEA
ncbi:AzlC family ABC transporter permease [Parafannyhessea umbonata]|uniref:Predicted branched-chain amino acid permease (Azaleucine resistance) n=1 Tax=Parafannyhessea umbonata TaxID=604330 RepID=A0A1H1L5V6_9ACTN|nr:AzlC family ABC transporter permease [Parafannyhessea umbonata]SDR69866.1 Predicted branched-chain amino acid permease (azaleucine resistance) [Parafannyhessea umbonata]